MLSNVHEIFQSVQYLFLNWFSEKFLCEDFFKKNPFCSTSNNKKSYGQNVPFFRAFSGTEHIRKTGTFFAKEYIF